MYKENSYRVEVLFSGYSKDSNEGFSSIANCSCTLITGPHNVIVDTMTAWDGPKLLQALRDRNLTPDDIEYVVCTHGHSDHIGCNYLFQNAKLHIVGYCVSHGDNYLSHDFSSGKEFAIDSDLKVVPTPGHTLQDVSVIVKTGDKGTVVVTGDLFECEEDLRDESIWIAAGSDSQELQRLNRKKILDIADWIIPGHGSMFQIKQ